MPQLSERQALFAELDQVLSDFALFGETGRKDFEDILEAKAAISSFRFINLKSYLRRNRSMHDMFFRYGPREFRQLARMDQPSFIKLHDIIAADPVFETTY